MAARKIAVALTAEAEAVLGPVIDQMWTIPWAKDRDKPICLVCDHVDFSGPFVELQVLPAKEDQRKGNSPALWIPHAFVILAFDFSKVKKMGFG